MSGFFQRHWREWWEDLTLMARLGVALMAICFVAELAQCTFTAAGYLISGPASVILTGHEAGSVKPTVVLVHA